MWKLSRGWCKTNTCTLTVSAKDLQLKINHSNNPFSFSTLGIFPWRQNVSWCSIWTQHQGPWWNIDFWTGWVSKSCFPPLVGVTFRVWVLVLSLCGGCFDPKLLFKGEIHISCQGIQWHNVLLVCYGSQNGFENKDRNLIDCFNSLNLNRARYDCYNGRNLG